MEDITLNITGDGLKDALDRLNEIKGGAEPALMRALNSAGFSLRSIAVKEVVKTFNVSLEFVKLNMSKAKPGRLSVTVGRRGKKWLAKWFPHDPNTMPRQRGGKAVFLRPRRDGTGSRYLDEHHPEGAEHPVGKAFMAHGPRTGEGIFARIGPYRERLTTPRGMSVPEMLNEPDVRSAIQRSGEYALQAAIDKEIQKLLESSRESRGEST